MLIQLLSDLHFEFRQPKDDLALLEMLTPPADRRPDLLVLAGDAVQLSERTRAQVLVKELSARWTDVLWVMGNHEYYETAPDLIQGLISDLKVSSNIEIVTTPRAVALKGQRLLCGTMWYSQEQVEGTGCIDAKTGCWVHSKKGRLVQFSDFRQISNFAPYHMNSRFQALLSDELGPTDIVVSHHLPSLLCVPERFRAEIDNVFYVCDQDALIRERQPKFWLHGHTHDDVDVQVGATRIWANPLGYPQEREKRGSHFDALRCLLET